MKSISIVFPVHNEKNNLEETEVAVQEPKEDTPLEEEPSDGLMTRRV